MRRLQRGVRCANSGDGARGNSEIYLGLLTKRNASRLFAERVRNIPTVRSVPSAPRSLLSMALEPIEVALQC